jgi:Rhamnogalacturonan lyase family 11, C-terminal domain
MLAFLTMLSMIPAATPPVDGHPPASAFQLISECSLAKHGGIPFPVDLDGDGRAEILWLQSPGLFHSKVFDKPPWQGRFSDEERAHFCLTATDAQGKVLWRIGEPWQGERPFVTHSAERALDFADIDGDGALEIVCVRRDEVLVINATTGEIKRSTKAPADNPQIVQLAHTGPGPGDWTILVKNAESAYPPHEYANPAWFYSPDLTLLKTADYLGAGHMPVVADVDGDGFDEFIVGFNLVDHDLATVWTFQPVPEDIWDAGEMHADDIVLGELGGKPCVVVAASDTFYVLDAATGELLWKRKGTHPQHCQIGRFMPGLDGTQAFVHNKRAELQLFDAKGEELWQMMPPRNFPLGAAEPCKKQQFHVFDPTTQLCGMGPEGTDLLIFTDGGWPYVIDGTGKRCLELPYTENTKQDWGDVPGRPDDYGYGFYARVADFDGDGAVEVLINDRRFTWLYKPAGAFEAGALPRSDARVLHVDFENYQDGVVQALNAGVRWLGDPFANREEGTVEITRGFSFSGNRCAHVETAKPDQIGRVRLQKRYDMPDVEGDAVVEVVFRPVEADATDLDDLTVWSSGRAGLTLFANGTAKTGTYRLDVLHGGAPGNNDPARTDSVATNLKQDEWVRIVMCRKVENGMVSLWAGRPDGEAYVGAFPDLNPHAPLSRAEIGDTSEDKHRGSGFWDDIRIGSLLEERGGVAPPEPRLRDVSQELPEVKVPFVVGRQKFLFVDDAIIESAEDVERVLHSVKKHQDNPLIVPEHPWEGQCVLLYGAVIRDLDTGKLRMWYLAWGKHVGKPTFICYAESDDGLTWTKPNLGLVEYEGSKDNNILMPGWSQTTIIYDPHDKDPSRRYKGVLRLNGTRGFFSPDGFHWDDQGIILEQAYDGTTVHWDPVDDKWVAMVKIFRDGKRARGYAESNDFLHWTDTYFMLTVDDQDQPGDQMYAVYMFPYEGVYFGLLRMYNTKNDKIDVQLMTSRNAKHWDRSIRTPFIPTADERGTWDFGNNAVPSTPPIRVGDELWFYYCGRSTLHDVVPNDGAIGLGTLRLDGFFSMKAGANGGTVTTKALRLDGNTLYLNANAAGGSIAVEVLDEGGTPIKLFDLDSSMAITEDSVRVAVQWKGGETLKALKDKTVRLRFHLTSADMYAFWVE